jgi:hypothetical protein
MKPSDFFLGVVNFLGVLVPGAALLLLRGCYGDYWLFHGSPVPPWLVFGGAAYVVGQLLLASTEILNLVAGWVATHWTKKLGPDINAFLEEAKQYLPLLKNPVTSPQSQFHIALSFLRLEKSAAVAEIDHHMADYKLLRNLVAVLAIDWVVRAISMQQEKCLLLIVEGVAFVLTFIAFVRMLGWAKLLAYQYVCLIGYQKKNSTEAPNASASGS